MMNTPDRHISMCVYEDIPNKFRVWYSYCSLEFYAANIMTGKLTKPNSIVIYIEV